MKHIGSLKPPEMFKHTFKKRFNLIASHICSKSDIKCLGYQITILLNFTTIGFVKVSAQLSRQQERDLIVKIKVEDTGIGIPKEKQDEIFIQFKRLTPSYEGIYKGAGLGLAIVKQFIDELDGEIYVDDREEGGTCFTLLFSLKESLVQDELGAEKTPISPALKGPKKITIEPATSMISGLRKDLSQILLVEDQTLAAKVVISMLSHLDCQVDYASSGQEALKLFQEKPYDLILMDIGLPGMDGYEVTKRIRLFELNKDTHIPVIALTAHLDEENKKHCIDTGNAVLSKPLTKEKAKDVLNAFIPYRESVSSQPVKVEKLLFQDKTLDMDKLNDLVSGKKEAINEILIDKFFII